MNFTLISDPTGTSWVFVVLFTLFFLTCVRINGNIKFAGAFLRDIVEVRERKNIFDVTVRETSFIVLAMLLSACSIGVLLFCGASIFGRYCPQHDFMENISLHLEGAFLPIALCMGISIAYMGLMWMVYYLVGLVFSDIPHTRMWLRGYTSSMAIGSIFFFPLALLALSYPMHMEKIAIGGFIVLILVKFLFIIKGFRIFFTESSSWVVFLYYLCSLEIIPLSITFGLTCSLLGQPTI